MATHRREVIWTQRARDALDEAAAYVAEDSPEATVNLVERALDAAESLSTFSQSSFECCVSCFDLAARSASTLCGLALSRVTDGFGKRLFETDIRGVPSVELDAS